MRAAERRWVKPPEDIHYERRRKEELTREGARCPRNIAPRAAHEDDLLVLPGPSTRPYAFANLLKALAIARVVPPCR